MQLGDHNHLKRLRTNPRVLLWILNGLLLVLLGGYVIVGDVPFHGDESMQIYMSRDYYDLVQTRNVDALLYRESVNTEIEALNQELRIINGTVTKLTIGLAWDLAGYTVNDLNQPWYWGMPDEWSWNIANHGMPSDRLLRYARLPSTLFTALSIGVIFAITWVITHKYTASWVSALIYATYPAVLLNGRRAMMEGSYLFFSALVILSALKLSEAATLRRRIIWAVLLGLTSGLAVASKHTAVLTVVLAFMAVGVLPVVQRRASKEETTGELPLSTFIFPLCIAGLVAGGVFLALNPAWWSDPIQTAKEVLDRRQTLLDQQIAGAKATGDDYDHLGQRLEQLAAQGLDTPRQYYEVPYWADYIAGQIADYERGWLDGRSQGPLWTAVLLALLSAGIADLVKWWREEPAWIGLVWLVGTVVVLLIMVPLNWQRYYLPLFAPVSVVCGVGAVYIITVLRRVTAAKNKTIW